MLGAELAAYQKRLESGDALPPQRPSVAEPPSLSTLSISAVGRDVSMVSQSLPSSGHLSAMGKGPPKPRVGPSDPPRPTLTQLPILELPEASPKSSSLLSDSHNVRTIGTKPRNRHEDDTLRVDGGTSLLEVPSVRQGSFVYAASAPATMLWGPGGPRRHGGSSMGGRTPSNTLLSALSNRDGNS